MSGATDDQVVVALTTAPSVEVAERIGRSLVEERLAACANVVGGITSIFRWDDAVQRESEALVILKTTVGSVEALERRLAELHPYEVPELIAFPITAGHAPYLEWVRAEVGDDVP
ncbi:MAG TPA: divalent-cation tolerance protein CutA [Longimicrobiales bacterium]|nr:divalent-cation tolerance protein CutA [Longimicrobiales bacterium]